MTKRYVLTALGICLLSQYLILVFIDKLLEGSDLPVIYAFAFVPLVIKYLPIAWGSYYFRAKQYIKPLYIFTLSVGSFVDLSVVLGYANTRNVEAGFRIPQDTFFYIVTTLIFVVIFWLLASLLPGKRGKK